MSAGDVPLARSSREGRASQTYAEHVRGVFERASSYIENMRAYVDEDTFDYTKRRLLSAAELHDLGKLAPENQAALRDDSWQGRLPLPHQSAGAWHLYRQGDELAAALVYGHHPPGLPNIIDRRNDDFPFCHPFLQTPFRTREDFDEQVHACMQQHEAALGGRLVAQVLPETGHQDPSPLRGKAMGERMQLSMIVDADWSDAAGKMLRERKDPLWSDRLEKLDAYVESVEKNADNGNDRKRSRNDLRHELYLACRKAGEAGGGALPSRFASCEALVGLGKTTALAAWALARARSRGLRHVFFVLPYTSILKQIEKVLREAIVLEGENVQEVIGVLHHRAEYDDCRLRSIASSWDAPVILTTSVQLFETLAANSPARLRKLHQLPGSVIVLDEFHASLPPDCLPVAWEWLVELVERWGCEIVLSSGTMVRFWQDRRFRRLLQESDSAGDSPEDFPSIEPMALVDVDLQSRMEQQEVDRVRVRQAGACADVSALIDVAVLQPGPRIIMVDTRRTAALVACELEARGHDVCHLSNAFTPRDCSTILEHVKQRLEEAHLGAGDEPDSPSSDWTLVATTYVGMGLDLSFRTGLIRAFSCAAGLQLLGRVARDFEYPDASLWFYDLNDARAPLNQQMVVSRHVLQTLIEKGIGGTAFDACPPSALATASFREECKQSWRLGDEQEKLLASERYADFASVAESFKVIKNGSNCLAIVDDALVEGLRRGVSCDASELQNRSVSLYAGVVRDLGLAEVLPGVEGVYALSENRYDPELLGYFKTLVAPG